MPYCVIISRASWCNTTTFYSINTNNYIIDTTKLFGKEGKFFSKNGLLGN